MALKAKMGAEEYSALADDQKEYYSLDAESGEYIADIGKALYAAEKFRQHKDRAIDSKKKKDDLVAELEREKEEALKNSGNFKELYELEIAKAEDAKGTIAELQERIANIGVNEKLGNAKSGIMSDLVEGGRNRGLELYLGSRIKAVKIEDDVHVIVLDEDGNKTTKSIDDLKAEIREMDDFKPVLKGRGSSGGGANNDGGADLGGDLKKYKAAFQKDTFDAKVQKELLMKDPALFKKLQAEAHAERRK